MLNIVYIGFLINLKYVTTPQSAIRLPPSRLPPRSVLLFHRGVHRTPAPLTQGRQFFAQTIGGGNDLTFLLCLNKGNLQTFQRGVFYRIGGSAFFTVKYRYNLCGMIYHPFISRLKTIFTVFGTYVFNIISRF